MGTLDETWHVAVSTLTGGRVAKDRHLGRLKESVDAVGLRGYVRYETVEEPDEPWLVRMGLRERDWRP